MIKLFNQKAWVLKKPSFFFGFFLLISFLFYPFSASAFWQTIVNAITYIPFLIIGWTLVLVILLTQAFAWLMGFILDVAIGPSFVSLSFTNPANNQIIKAGLSITQSFVNILLVTALVYTALSIALRINETAAKKMLARLIVVALLVNFAPVFCGLVVDGANIVMYYFLEPIKEGVSGVLTQIGTHISILINLLKKVFADLPERFGLLMMAVTQIIINIMMGVAFLLFAGVFLLRYIAIWILVVLAPIAFTSWVFPKEGPSEAWEFMDIILLPLRILRGFWDRWLREFITWSIIGIPTAFFLYLAMGSFSLMNAAFKQKMTMPGIEPAASDFLNNVFPYLVVIIFLYLGFAFSMQTGEKASEAIIAGGRATFREIGAKSGKGVRAVRRDVKEVWRTYKEEVERGAGPIEALKPTLKGYWTRRIKPAITPSREPIMIGRRQIVPPGRPAQVARITGKPLWATLKGTFSAIKEITAKTEKAALKHKEERSKKT